LVKIILKGSEMTPEINNNKSKSGASDDMNSLFIRALIEQIPHSIYFKDLKSRYTKVNRSFAENSCGVKSPDEVTGKTDFDFFTEEQAKQAYEDEQKIIKTGKPLVDAERKQTTGKGETRLCLVTKMPFYDKNGKIIGTFGISRNITVSKKALEKKLRGGETTYFKTLMDNIPDSVYFKDRQSRFVFMNHALVKNLSLKSEKDVIGKTDLDVFSDEHARQAFEDEQKIIKTGKPMLNYEEKETFLDKPDRWVSTSKFPWFDEDGKIIGIFGISSDITERKNFAYNLEKQTNFFNTLMNNIPDSVYFKDRDSKFVLINLALAKVLGLKDPEESYGKTDFDVFSDEHARQAFEDEQRIIKTGKPMVNIEEKETWKGREPRWISTTKMPFYDRRGNIIGTFGISRNITDRKKAEEKVEYLSFHDVLTGLYNRAFLEEELKRLDSNRQLPLSLIMGDANGLKLINDVYGHEQGDIFLKKIADILRDAFRKEDLVSRWGGDEFIVLLPRTTAKEAQIITRRVSKMCQERSTPSMPLSISLGVSTKRSPEEDIGDILKQAEGMMYRKKLSDSKPVQETLIESFKASLEKESHEEVMSPEKKESYALSLAKKLNLSLVKIEELKLLINLHNIGKLALVDEIMSKRGRLTREEWKIIKEVPLIGYRIADSSSQLKPIAEAILSHHEWYDGTGYPRGIKGEEIPVLSRISFIINSYEAMISERPYRGRMTKKQAIEELKKYSGKQFDPKIASLFINMLEKEPVEP
jgi:diguanylate cyclase (GGDEF)-like protein/PAS domain S-box-containing protein